MTHPVRIGLSILALGLAELVTGCTSQPRHVRAGQPANDFEIVETSTSRQLTPREMAYLRAKVADYLAQQGQTGSGDYYVKIYLGEEAGVVAQGEWVVVRYTRYPATTYYVAAPQPAYSYPAYNYSTFDYYPFGWLGFGAFSFRYHDDPYYHGYYPYLPRHGYPRHVGGYWPNRNRWDHRRHDPDNKHDGDRKPDRDRGDDKRRGDTRPRLPGSGKPTFIPANVRREQGYVPPPINFHDRRPDDASRRFGAGEGSQARRWERRSDSDQSRQRGTGFTPGRPNSPGRNDEPRTFQHPVRNSPNRERLRTPGSTTRPGDAGEVAGPRHAEPRERSYSPAPRPERPERSGVTEGRGRDSSRPEPAPRQESPRSYERPVDRTNSTSERVHEGGGRDRGSSGRRGEPEP